MSDHSSTIRFIDFSKLYSFVAASLIWNDNNDINIKNINISFIGIRIGGVLHYKIGRIRIFNIHFRPNQIFDFCSWKQIDMTHKKGNSNCKTKWLKIINLTWYATKKWIMLHADESSQLNYLVYIKKVKSNPITIWTYYLLISNM